LAIRTSIPPSVWAAEGERAIYTAVQLLNDADAGHEPDAPEQMSG